MTVRTDPFEQLRNFEAQYIPFPTFVAAKDAVEANLRLFRETGIARHMVVVGESGTGKSSLCRWLTTQHPRTRLLERDKVDLLLTSVPPSATITSVIDAMLHALGDPWHRQGTVAAKTARLITLCKKCGVEFLLFDEAQHLHDRGASTTHYLVGDWLKSVIDEIGVPTALIGLPRLENLLVTNDQLRRRYSRRVQLALGQSDTHSIETECLQLFLSLVSLIGTPVSSDPFGAQEMSERLFRSSDGRIAYIKRLLLAALRRVLEHGLEAIDATVLEQAFTEEIWWEGVGKLNPFNPAFEFRRLDRGGEPFQQAGLGARRSSK
jgi:DNA transposition AAA+ family ATPase